MAARYTTVSKVRQRARDVDVATRTNADIDSIITARDSMIDGELKAAFPDLVPFTTTPAIVGEVSLNWSAGYLYNEVIRQLQGETSGDEYGNELIREAKQVLEGVKTGVILLQDVQTHGEEFDRTLSSNYDTDTDTAIASIFTRGVNPASWRFPEEMTTVDEDIKDRTNL